MIFKNWLLITAISFGFMNLTVAQNQSTSPIELVSKKTHGTLYFMWGYNRDWYSKSTIHFENTDPNTKTGVYDFTFIDAKAHDKPDMDRYWEIKRLTIPQYDMHLGYLFNDKHDLGIEIGWNHLKYVVTDNQVIHVRGTFINPVTRESHYIDKDTLVTPDFVHLQHTNGNNYLLLNLVKRQKLWLSKHIELSAIGKVGAGPLISYTISTILGSNDKGRFHYHGWVAGTSLGLRFTFYKYLFIQTDLQGAYVKYTNTELGEERTGRATHHFYSLQYMWSGGINIPLSF